jgi:proteasome beta subunit
VKLRHSSSVGLSGAIDIALEALLEASEEDSATGGPDLLRGIFPVVAKIDSNGFERIPDEELESRTEIMVQNISERGNS